jgi:hypothetical protein
LKQILCLCFDLADANESINHLADRTQVLKFVLQTLGRGLYLDVSLVCKAWRDSYRDDVRHGSAGPVTSFMPYLQDAAMWASIQEHGMHLSIAPEALGQHACDAVLVETLGLPYTAQLAAHSKALQSLRPADAAFEVWSSEAVDWAFAQELHLKKNAKKLQALTAAHAAFNSSTNSATTAESAQRILGIAAGAAKAGRLLLFADALMKWRGDASQLPERLADTLAACASQSTDAAALDKVVRACVLLSDLRLPDTGDVQACLSWAQLWSFAAGSCTSIAAIANLPLSEFANFSGSLTLSESVMAQPSFLALNLNTFKKALMKAIVRRGAPVLHVYFIEQIAPTSHRGTSAVTECLAQQVARRGRTDVLDHLYDKGLLCDARAVRAIQSGAIECDTVATVQWLTQHGLLSADFRGKLVALCHRKINAYFAEVDAKAAAAVATTAVATAADTAAAVADTAA